jgi:hypothetical protein
VKLLPPLGRMAGFRNTRNYGLAWNSLEGHSFLQRFSEGQHSTPFIHGTEDLKSEPHKAVPHVIWEWTQFLQISDGKLNNKYCTLTQIIDILSVVLYMNFLPSIYLKQRWGRPESLNTRTLVHSIYCHSVNDRFWFNESSACLSSGYTQWVWKSL